MVCGWRWRCFDKLKPWQDALICVWVCVSVSVQLENRLIIIILPWHDTQSDTERHNARRERLIWLQSVCLYGSLAWEEQPTIDAAACYETVWCSLQSDGGDLWHLNSAIGTFLWGGNLPLYGVLKGRDLTRYNILGEFLKHFIFYYVNKCIHFGLQ